MRTPPNRSLACSVGLGALMIATGCVGPEGSRQTDTRLVVVHNDSEEALWLFRAVRDGWAKAQPLGANSKQHLNLSPGRYALGITPDVATVPLPLPTEELGFSAPRSLEVTVGRQPPPEKDWGWIPAGPCLLGDDL